MNVPIVAGDIVDDGGFSRRFVRVSDACMYTADRSYSNFTVS